MDDHKVLEAIGVPEPSLWSGSITDLKASTVRNSLKINVKVGQLFDRKVGRATLQFAYIIPTDVEAT